MDELYQQIGLILEQYGKIADMIRKVKSSKRNEAEFDDYLNLISLAGEIGNVLTLHTKVERILCAKEVAKRILDDLFVIDLLDYQINEVGNVRTELTAYYRIKQAAENIQSL